ncbi:MAG: alpha/beta hydrolase [Sedimentisphaerales bacterium]
MTTSNRNFSVVEYFNRKAAQIKPHLRFQGNSRAGFQKWQVLLRTEIKTLLGQTPVSVPLNPEVVWEIEDDGLVKRRVIIDTEEDMSVAALVYIPTSARKKPCPAILCNHGHGKFAKDSVMGIRSGNEPERNAEIAAFNYDYGLQMAKRGYVTMAIDYMGFGERADGGVPYPDRDKCNVHFIRGNLMDLNLLTLNIRDAQRCLDYLCSLKFVDAGRIGTMGLSFGGTMTTWIAMMDQRIKAADIICYSCRFKNFAVERGNFCGSQYLPGLFAICDVPDLHGLIAPRPLLAEIGVHDKCFLEYEALSCADEVKKIYAAAGSPQNYEVDLFNSDHKFAGNKAFGFFDKHLKG